jgi:hypothetical protein
MDDFFTRFSRNSFLKMSIIVNLLNFAEKNHKVAWKNLILLAEKNVNLVEKLLQSS